MKWDTVEAEGVSSKGLCWYSQTSAREDDEVRKEHAVG